MPKIVKKETAGLKNTFFIFELNGNAVENYIELKTTGLNSKRKFFNLKESKIHKKSPKFSKFCCPGLV